MEEWLRDAGALFLGAIGTVRAVVTPLEHVQVGKFHPTSGAFSLVFLPLLIICKYFRMNGFQFAIRTALRMSELKDFANYFIKMLSFSLFQLQNAVPLHSKAFKK